MRTNGTLRYEILTEGGVNDRMASFTIMIELAEFPYNSVKLERLGEYLGEYQVLNAEPLTSVGRTKITV